MGFEMKMEIELISKKDLPKKVIHDLTDIYKETYICPFCKYKNIDITKDSCYDETGKWIVYGNYGLFKFKPQLCSPCDRLYWKQGFLKLTKKYCSIPDYHSHYECKICKTHWIVMIDAPYNPISYID